MFATEIDAFSMKSPIFHPCLIFRQNAANALKKASRRVSSFKMARISREDCVTDKKNKHHTVFKRKAGRLGAELCEKGWYGFEIEYFEFGAG